MQPVQLVLVGGFLGAGKTTLLAQAAGRLVRQGKRVGLMTNDQAADLVDTELLRRAGFGVQEVSGGCFCCQFSELLAASGKLINQLRPDILLAEPVGSCTDLSATVLQPLKGLYGDFVHLAPFSVLADPERLREAFATAGEAPASLPEKVMYIFRKQLEEADLVVVNKADLLSEAQLAELKALLARHLPEAEVMTLSALTGEGVDEWLSLVLDGHAAGRRIASVDYGIYTEGEAALGWLNATFRLTAEAATDWRELCRELLRTVQEDLRRRSAEVAHVKLLLACAGGSLVANLTSTQGRPLVRGVLEGDHRQATLILNARVHAAPDDIRQAVETALASAGRGIRVEAEEMHSLRPGAPRPTHRFDRVV